MNKANKTLPLALLAQLKKKIKAHPFPLNNE
jgi:hypothetical protein